MVEILTPRCLLRPMHAGDFTAICRYLQDAEVMYAWGHTLSDPEVNAWIQRQQERYASPGYGALAIVLRSTGELVGQCGLTMQLCQGVRSKLAVQPADSSESPPLAHILVKTEPEDLHVPEVGYMLARQYWGYGYAREAALACLRFGFTSLALPEIFACIKVGNTRSLAVAERLGMRVCGYFDKHYRGEVMPHLLYVVNAEYFSAVIDREEEYAVNWRR